MADIALSGRMPSLQQQTADPKRSGSGSWFIPIRRTVALPVGVVSADEKMGQVSG